MPTRPLVLSNLVTTLPSRPLSSGRSLSECTVQAVPIGSLLLTAASGLRLGGRIGERRAMNFSEAVCCDGGSELGVLSNAARNEVHYEME